MLSARPGLELLCIGGPQPRALGSSGGFVDEAWLESFEPEIPGAARGVGALGAPKISSDANRLSADPSLHPVGHILECTPVDPLYWQVNSTGTIRNDDDPPRITVDNPTAAENAGTIDFTVRLEAATAVDVEFTALTGLRLVQPTEQSACALEAVGAAVSAVSAMAGSNVV